MKELMSEPGVSKPWLLAPSTPGPVSVWPVGKKMVSVFLKGCNFFKKKDEEMTEFVRTPKT